MKPYTAISTRHYVLHANFNYVQSPYDSCLWGTQTSPDLAKIGHLITFSLKNDVKRSIIWHNSGLLRLHLARPNIIIVTQLFLANFDTQNTGNHLFKHLGTSSNIIRAIRHIKHN